MDAWIQRDCYHKYAVVHLSRGSESWSLGNLAVVAARLPCPEWIGIIPLIPFANKCKLWSMPWSSNVNCLSLNPSELEIWKQIPQSFENLALRLKLWAFSLSVRLCVYPRFSGDWPSSCCWCQACSTASCDSVLRGELWQQKEGEMIQTKETGQKRKLDPVDSWQHLIIRKKTPTKPNELWSISSSEIWLPTLL